nr:hypothetical protein [Endozoicomonas sp.]
MEGSEDVRSHKSCSEYDISKSDKDTIDEGSVIKKQEQPGGDHALTEDREGEVSCFSRFTTFFCQKRCRSSTDHSNRQGYTLVNIGENATATDNTSFLSQVQSQTKQIESLSDDLSFTRAQVVELVEANKTQASEIASLVDLMNEHGILADNLQTQIDALNDTTYDGSSVFTIEGVDKKTEDAKSGKAAFFDSPPFYTQRGGYKLCTRVYLNGAGEGKGTDISVGIRIMKGKYDQSLSWPFARKVNFLLLDQARKEHVVDGFKPGDACFRPRGATFSTAAFRRPEPSDNNPDAVIPFFISWEELVLLPNRYLVNDTLWLKTIVDTSTDDGIIQ